MVSVAFAVQNSSAIFKLNISLERSPPSNLGYLLRLFLIHEGFPRMDLSLAAATMLGSSQVVYAVAVQGIALLS